MVTGAGLFLSPPRGPGYHRQHEDQRPTRGDRGGAIALMTAEEAFDLVEKCGILLESARGPIPNLVESIVGSPVGGSWWGHPRSHEIFTITRTVRESPNILVCRLVGGKITYVHRRLWPALARLSHEIPPESLASITEVHCPSGRHEVTETPLAEWLPENVQAEAARLSSDEARREIGPLIV